MNDFLKDLLNWWYLALFKPLTLVEKTKNFKLQENLKIFLRVYILAAIIVFLFEGLIGLICGLFGIGFNWIEGFQRTTIAIGFGLVFGLYFGVFDGLYFGLIGGLVGGLVGSLVGGLVGGLGVSLGAGLIFGLVGSLIFGLVGGLGSGQGIGLGGLGSGLILGLVGGLSSGLISGLFFSLVNGLVGGPSKEVEEGITFVLSFGISFLFIFLRPFYIFSYLRKRTKRTKKNKDLLFGLFKDSPVYWDEDIVLPLPYLSDWLVQMLNQDRKRGLVEIDYIVKKSPYQRSSAQKALLTIAAQDLSKYKNIEELQKADEIVEFIPDSYSNYWQFREKDLKDLSDFKRRVKEVADLAKDYQSRETLSGKLDVLENLYSKIESLHNSMAFSPESLNFLPAVEKWSKIVEREQAQLKTELKATPIPNPYIAGKPLDNTDKNHNVFMGRRDIIRVIEENIINPHERNSLLLYGRRRIGKTSTLKNLQGFLSQYVTVYIDFQNANWRDSNSAFCYNLIKQIYVEFERKSLIRKIPEIRIEEFEKNTYTKFNDYLDLLEKEAINSGRKILLTFDEYEKLEEDFEKSNITKEVFNQLRSIVQHREQIVVLFSGGHRFEEMKNVNWSDYLINTKTLELSFLSKADAEKLLTEPVPKLIYEDGVKERIIELTHCQPYLLQAFGSDLVNHLNAENRFNATKEDSEIITEKVLTSAGGYFHDTWSEEMSAEEQEIMRILANEGEKDSQELPSESALRKLIRKEVVEEINGKCKLTIEFFCLYLLKKRL